MGSILMLLSTVNTIRKIVSRKTTNTFLSLSLVLANLLSADLMISYGTPLQYSCLENPMDGGAW